MSQETPKPPVILSPEQVVQFPVGTLKFFYKPADRESKTFRFVAVRPADSVFRNFGEMVFRPLPLFKNDQWTPFLVKSSLSHHGYPDHYVLGPWLKMYYVVWNAGLGNKITFICGRSFDNQNSRYESPMGVLSAAYRNNKLIKYHDHIRDSISRQGFQSDPFPLPVFVAVMPALVLVNGDVNYIGDNSDGPLGLGDQACFVVLPRSATIALLGRPATRKSPGVVGKLVVFKQNYSGDYEDFENSLQNGDVINIHKGRFISVFRYGCRPGINTPNLPPGYLPSSIPAQLTNSYDVEIMEKYRGLPASLTKIEHRLKQNSIDPNDHFWFPSELEQVDLLSLVYPVPILIDAYRDTRPDWLKADRIKFYVSQPTTFVMPNTDPKHQSLSDENIDHPGKSGYRPGVSPTASSPAVLPNHHNVPVSPPHFPDNSLNVTTNLDNWLKSPSTGNVSGRSSSSRDGSIVDPAAPQPTSGNVLPSAYQFFGYAENSSDDE